MVDHLFGCAAELPVRSEHGATEAACERQGMGVKRCGDRGEICHMIEPERSLCLRGKHEYQGWSTTPCYSCVGARQSAAVTSGEPIASASSVTIGQSRSRSRCRLARCASTRCTCPRIQRDDMQVD